MTRSKASAVTPSLVRGVHVAPGVQLRAAQRGGDERPQVALLAGQVDALEVGGEHAVAHDPDVEVVDGGGDGGRTADPFVDGGHASTDASHRLRFPGERGY